jgi:polysaccharide export outer membrane protein
MLLLAGCGAMPAPGPSTTDITDSAGPTSGYALIPLSPQVLATLDALKPPSLAATFGNAEPQTATTLGIGDVVSVTIWDAGGGLFSANPQGTVGTQTTVIPNQAVDTRGNITIPFAGQIHVAGKSTAGAQEAIKGALASQALKPQALVSVISGQGNLVTVVGDVKTPGRVASNVGGTRILDAIAMAGGTTSPAYDSAIQLTRGRQTSRERLSAVLADPTENIYLKPNDVLYVVHDPKTVAVLGALKNNTRMQFDTERVSLAEVIGQSGGLVDQLSEPAGVFVFRVAPPAVVTALGAHPQGGAPTAVTPVIFRADFRRAQDFFLAQEFQMQDKDIVYVANTDSVQIDKILKMLLHATGVVGPFVNRNGAFVSGN